MQKRISTSPFTDTPEQHEKLLAGIVCEELCDFAEGEVVRFGGLLDQGTLFDGKILRIAMTYLRHTPHR